MKIDSLIESIKALPAIDFARLKNLILSGELGAKKTIEDFLIGKRFLSSKDFATPKQISTHFDQRPVDEAILEDTTLSYRVADLTTDIFSDSYNSYWHKNIGGYSPAKLQRYQELIDSCLYSEINSILEQLSAHSREGRASRTWRPPCQS